MSANESAAAEPQQKDFDFMRVRLHAAVISMVLVLGSFIAFAVNGLHLGLDFTGGTLVELSFRESAELGEVRATLEEAGFERASVVHFGTDRDVLVRLPTSSNTRVGEDIVSALEKSGASATLRRTEMVGSQMGEEMRSQAILAVLLGLALVGAYVSIQFQWKLAVGAVLALAHDPIVVLGAFALFGWDVDFTVLAAVLALIGYSINDTVVVYDRLRENFRKMRRMDRFQISNASLNQTLGRTLMTSGVTLISVIALLLFGGETLRGFALTLTIGIVVGTYSSIYVATSLSLWLGLDRKDLMLPQKDETSADGSMV